MSGTSILNLKKILNNLSFCKKDIEKYNPDLVVLAGFMRILSPIMTSAFKGKMINIHPSLLPKYPGLNTHEQVIANNDAEHGVTIHSVSEAVSYTHLTLPTILLV
mgnify:CR=1 FL=1